MEETTLRALLVVISAATDAGFQIARRPRSENPAAAANIGTDSNHIRRRCTTSRP